ncbi:MAG: zinc ribbon domain-containing protein [Verrucomicrobia bacterium]|nr:MAG: zinc ribbon domain-containing protein [Verrucomicrobiota bacterium]
MPLHRYRPTTPPCRICGTGFEVVQPSGEPPLKECPTCGRSVIRDQASAVSTPKVTRPTSRSEAKSAGFKVFKRTSDGNFERQ